MAVTVEYVGGPLCGVQEAVHEPMPTRINRPTPAEMHKNGGGTPGLPLVYIPQPTIPPLPPVIQADGSRTPRPRSRNDERGRLVYMYEFVGFYRCGDAT